MVDEAGTFTARDVAERVDETNQKPPSGQCRARLAADGIWPVRLPWVMAQRWAHLLYLHYRVAPDVVRRLVPEPLEIDEFDGTAWVSVVPLRMERVHLRGIVPIPGTTDFPEVNVRTYVVHDGVPGVYFLSIDAASRFSCSVARSSFRLPYRDAVMSLTEHAGTYRMRSERRSDRSIGFEAEYRPTGAIVPDPPGSQTRFLAERYCMYATTRPGRLVRGDISHLPWVVQSAEVTIHRNDLLAENGLSVLDPVPVTGYTDGSDSLCWPMRAASAPQRIWPRR
jgi:uncharacterized protein YqjF (DUF2071 family)